MYSCTHLLLGSEHSTESVETNLSDLYAEFTTKGITLPGSDDCAIMPPCSNHSPKRKMMRYGTPIT